MTHFAAVLTRSGQRWSGDEADLADCESLDDLADMLRDASGEVRLLLIEQDDEYAAIVRLDDDADDPRAFLSDGHSADRYPMAAAVAEEVIDVSDLDADDVPPGYDSSPVGDADLVGDLGTSAHDLVALCEHEGTLPVDLLLAVCEKAGCGEVFEELRG